MSYAYSRKHQQRSIIDDYEVIHQCGSGTYGFVFKAIHRQSKTIVALKKVTKFPTEEGAPVEIKYLSKLTSSKNVIRLRDHFFTKEGELALVFEYMETDLWRLISGPSPVLPLPHVKCIMKQLLEGLHQCHTAGIMHRDIKPSNLLINSSGVLKLADFGLTTSYISPTYLSNNVVSLYYRSPELLLGTHNYGPEIDVWSAGCILVELLSNNYLFAGANESEQLDMIFRMFGTPTEAIWPGVACLPGWGLIESSPDHPHPPCHLRDNYGYLDMSVLDLATRLLVLNPKGRISCYEALQHPWFWTTPLPSHPNNLPALWRKTPESLTPKRDPWRVASSSVSTTERRERGSRGSCGSCNSDSGSNHSGGIGSVNNNYGSNSNNTNNNNNNNNSNIRYLAPSSTPVKLVTPSSTPSGSVSVRSTPSATPVGGGGGGTASAVTVAVSARDGRVRAWTHSRASLPHNKVQQTKN